MALVGPSIKAEFHLDDVGFGWVISAFYLTYSVCQIPAGYLADRWDLRLTYAWAVVAWSAAGIASAFAPGLMSLLILRAMLGVCESLNWPCAIRATARVLPPADRSLGNGIFNSGAAIGAVVTPPIVTLLTAAFGWRTAFVSIGSLGFIWVAVWLRALGGTRRGILDKPPTETAPARGQLSLEARVGFGVVIAVALALAVTGYWQGLAIVWCAIATLMFGVLAVARVLPESTLMGAEWAERVGTIVRLRRFWVLMVVSVSFNVCWHFLVNWLPGFLRDDRGMSFLASGLWVSVPFIAADLGNVIGGAFSRSLASLGWTIERARFLVMAVTAVMIAVAGWLVPNAGDQTIIPLLALMAFGTCAFMANYFAFTQEVSTEHTGLIVGFLGGTGNLCAAGFIPLAGKIKMMTGSFGLVFVIVGLLPILGIILLVLGWGTPNSSTRIHANSEGA